MGTESYIVLRIFTDECCHPNRFRVELMLIESFEIRGLDLPDCDTFESAHCFSPNDNLGGNLSSISAAALEASLPEKTAARQHELYGKTQAKISVKTICHIASASALFFHVPFFGSYCPKVL